MIQDYTKSSTNRKPKKATVKFLINYSKNLHIVRVKNKSFEVFQS